jgi:transaldolase
MGTKEASYSDVKYVDALIGPNTVATLPLGTLNAYRDHGSPGSRLEHDLDRARALPQQLAELGIDLSAISAELEVEGIDKFVRPFDALHQALARRRSS